jgi:hypothetical protein
VQPDYDGRYQLMSELALGPYGWAMLPAFCFFALSILGVQHGLRSIGGSLPIRAVLVAAALTIFGAGVFRLGQATELHIALVALAFVLMVLAMYLLPSQAGSLSSRLARGISWVLAAATALSVLGGHSVLPIGTGQRLAAACVLIWLCFLGWQLVRR